MRFLSFECHWRHFFIGRRRWGWALATLMLALAANLSAAEPQRLVLLLLDGSASMNRPFEGRTTKIVALKSSLNRCLKALPDHFLLGVRALGLKEHASKGLCKDTVRLSQFDRLGTLRYNLGEHIRKIKPKGLTPLTHALQSARSDFPAEWKKERMIVLVSDGAENCAGDPCDFAWSLAAENAGLVIHTIGMDADPGAEAQLRCLARLTGGKFVNVHSLDGLYSALMQAMTLPAQPAPAPAHGEGRLRIKRADPAGHDVMDARSGAKVARLTQRRSEKHLKAGIYNLTVGGTLWKGIEVKANQDNWVTPAWLQVSNASHRGHYLLDPETRKRLALLNAKSSKAALKPGEYVVTFGPGNNIEWPVQLAAGQKVTLLPALLQVEKARPQGHLVTMADGRVVGLIKPSAARLQLPPGSYRIELNGGRVRFTLTAGQKRVFQPSLHR